MNFLAHFHLAWPDEERVAGGLEGDYHKGPVSDHFAPGFAAGIRLHRAIDAYTDEHSRLSRMRGEFPQSLRRYAGILMDLSFDHFLSRHWSDFSDIPLPHFNQQVYDILDRQQSQLSDRALLMAGRLRDYDLLGRYDDWKTVSESAERVGERFRRGNPLRDSGEKMLPMQQKLEQAFLDFYPDLVRFSANFQGRCT